MKKLILSGLIIATIGITINGCTKKEIPIVKSSVEIEDQSQKEEIIYTDVNDYSKLKVKNGVLEFESIEYYESFLDNSSNPKTDFLVNHIAEMSFESYAIQNREKSKNLIDDDFITSIIDRNQIVKIDQWFIKLNFETKKIYASSSENLDAYELVLKESEQNKQVYTFTMDDEVLVYLGNPESLKHRRWRCRDRKAKKNDEISKNENFATISGTPLKMNIRVRYRKFGIYFVLKAYGQHTNLYNNRLNYWFQLDNCSYNQRCGNSISNYSHPWRHPTSSFQASGIATRKFYGGTKQLKNYNFKVRLRCELTTDFTTNAYTTFFTDYVQISDY